MEADMNLLFQAAYLSSPSYLTTCPFGGWANNPQLPVTDADRLKAIHDLVAPEYKRLLDLLVKEASDKK